MDITGLRRLPVFSDLDEVQLRRVATFARERSVPAGEVLVREGDYAYDLTVIVDGEAVVEQHGREIARLVTGDVFGEIAVLERSPRTATVRSATPMLLVTLTHWDLKRVDGALERLRETMAARKRRDAEAAAAG